MKMNRSGKERNFRKRLKKGKGRNMGCELWEEREEDEKRRKKIKLKKEERRVRKGTTEEKSGKEEYTVCQKSNGEGGGNPCY
jgi:hypothetical protein